MPRAHPRVRLHGALALLLCSPCAAQLTPGNGRPTDFATPLLGGATLFAASSSGTVGRELWRTDGTQGGTRLVADIRPGRASSYPRDLVAGVFAGGIYYLTADDGQSGRELWLSDGTGSGTTLVADIRPGAAGSFPAQLTLVGATLFFTADDGASGRELWAHDAVGGARRVADILPGLAGSEPSGLVEYGGRLLFAADDGSNGAELWQSDGTGPGTSLVADIDPIPGRGSNPSELQVASGLLFFAAQDSVAGRELWRSDGTAQGTSLVADLWPGIEDAAPDQVTSNLFGVFFTADDGVSGRELYYASAGGAGQVADLWPGPRGAGIREMAGVGFDVWFCADDGSTGPELWRSDGTAAGTEPFEIVPGAAGGAPRDLVWLGSRLVFSAETTNQGREPWTCDGTQGGTVRVRDLRPGVASSYPSEIHRPGTGTTALFSGENADSGVELWSTDGIAVTPVANLDPTPTVPEYQLTVARIQGQVKSRATMVYTGPPGTPMVTLVSAQTSPPLPFAIISGLLRISLNAAPLPAVVTGANARATISLNLPLATVGTTALLASQSFGITTGLVASEPASFGIGGCGISPGYDLNVEGGALSAENGRYQLPLVASDPNANRTGYLGVVLQRWDDATQQATEILIDTIPYTPAADGAELILDGHVLLVPPTATVGDRLQLRYYALHPASPAGGCTLVDLTL